MSAPTPPREVVIQAIWNFITGEPATVNERADAILAALAAAPVETRIALARDMLAGTTHAVVPVRALRRLSDSYRYVSDDGPEHCGWTSADTEAAWCIIDDQLAAAHTEGKSDD